MTAQEPDANPYPFGCRPLRRQFDFTAADPGADAPGFALTPPARGLPARDLRLVSFWRVPRDNFFQRGAALFNFVRRK